MPTPKQAEVLYVLNNTDYNHDTVCGFLLGPGHCEGTELDPWTIEIPGGKPEPSHPEPEQVGMVLYYTILRISPFQIYVSEVCWTFNDWFIIQ